MMSDRERWIVYPMLVLSLALGVKGRYDAWEGTSEFNAITCRSLLVENELNEPIALIQQNDRGAAELNLAGAEGLVEASLTADEGGGRLLLMRRADQQTILFGHDKMREISGLWAVNRNTAQAPPTPLAIDTGDNMILEVLPWPTPAKSTPQDSSTPDSSTPDSSTPGSSTPGSSTPGSSTPGSSTPGSTPKGEKKDVEAKPNG